MAQTSQRIPWIDHLRGFIILLVVAHHSSLAYTSFASFDASAYIRSTHPVVDTVRSVLLDYFEDLNDIYFMSLLFLVSGLFAWRSLETKGRAVYLRGRFNRLFLPFLTGVTILMPLAYYPAWLEAHGRGGVVAFLIDYVTVERWPVGPPWFLWVLFVFDGVLAWIYPSIQACIQWAGDNLPRVRTGMELLLLAYIITWVLYVPLMLWTGPDAWAGIGPFDLQVSRVLLYFGYFILGAIVGRKIGEGGVFSPDGVFMRKWPFWTGGAILCFLLLKVSVSPLHWLVSRQYCTHQRAEWLYRSMWCLCCATSCMALLSLSPRLFRRGRVFWDSLAANSFLIYLLHYIFVTWCQWLLLPLEWPALVKFGVCCSLAFSCSWVSSVLITWLVGYFRRQPGQARRVAGFFR